MYFRGQVDIFDHLLQADMVRFPRMMDISIRMMKKFLSVSVLVWPHVVDWHRRISQWHQLNYLWKNSSFCRNLSQEITQKQINCRKKLKLVVYFLLIIWIKRSHIIIDSHKGWSDAFRRNLSILGFFHAFDNLIIPSFIVNNYWQHNSPIPVTLVIF